MGLARAESGRVGLRVDKRPAQLWVGTVHNLHPRFHHRTQMRMEV